MRLPEPVVGFQMLGFDGSRFFATIRPSNFDTASPPLADLYLISSTDGVHWQAVSLPKFTPASYVSAQFVNLVGPVSTPSAASTSKLYPTFEISVAMSAGGLLLSDETTLWRMRSATTSFQPIIDAPSTSRFTAFGTPVAAYRGDGHNIEVDLTAHGVHWHKAVFQ